MKYSPYESFKHGLTVSKLWLCETLEPHIKPESVVYILGSWTNILSYMMIIRNKNLYKSFHAFDNDPKSTEIAEQICDTWRFENPKVYNETKDANDVDFESCTIVINTSVEHMDNHTWFHNIKSGTLVCLQSSDVTITDQPWFITNPISNKEQLLEKYPLSEVLYLDSKEINYGNWGYNRLMLIGYK